MRISSRSQLSLIVLLTVTLGGTICYAQQASAAENVWTWLKGSDNSRQRGIYEDPDATVIVPGARSGSVGWSDASGRLYLFGGHGYDSRVEGWLNDLWRYDPVTNNWTWIKGGSTRNRHGIYGVRGNADIANTPGARSGAVVWSDASGRLYLFGGYGAGEEGSVGLLNDLWQYDPTTNGWTWLNGSKVVDQSGVYSDDDPAANVPSARENAAGWIGASGKLCLFGGSGRAQSWQVGKLNDLWQYDPATNNWTWIKGRNSINHAGIYSDHDPSANTPGARDSAVVWAEPLGEIYLFGGNGFDALQEQGKLNDLWRYDPSTNSWAWILGSDVRQARGVHGALGVAGPGSYPGARWGAIVWAGVSGGHFLFGGSGIDGSGSDHPSGLLNDVWRHDPATGSWIWVKGSRSRGQNGIYGSLGVTDALNTPGARTGAVCWVTDSGDIYLFGGGGYDSAETNSRPLNDLWRYESPVFPQIVSASAMDATTVRVVFSEAMKNGEALVSPANYFFSGGGVALTSEAVTRIDATTVDVEVNEMTDGADYTVRVEGGEAGPVDLAELHMDPAFDSVGFTGLAQAPDAPVMDAEPTWTDGSGNTVSWSAGGDAVTYTVVCDDADDFLSLVGSATVSTAPWEHHFSGLTDDVTYWYRVRGEDAAGNVSAWSAPESSRQNAVALSLDAVGETSFNLHIDDTVTLAVVAEAANGALSYQWYKDGESVGADAPTLMIGPLVGEDAGQFYCVAIDAVDIAQSPAFTLTVRASTSIPIGVVVVAVMAVLGLARRLSTMIVEIPFADSMIEIIISFLRAMRDLLNLS